MGRIVDRYFSEWKELSCVFDNTNTESIIQWITQKKIAFRHFLVHCLITQNTLGVLLCVHTSHIHHTFLAYNIVNHLFVGIHPTNLKRPQHGSEQKLRRYVPAVATPKDQLIDNSINTSWKENIWDVIIGSVSNHILLWIFIKNNFPP